MAKRMTILRGYDGWYVAHYDEDREDSEIIGLFGTHILPTPYGLNTPREVVAKRIKALNPDTITIQ